MIAPHWRVAAALSGGLLLLPLEAAHNAAAQQAPAPRAPLPGRAPQPPSIQPRGGAPASARAVQPQAVQALRNMSAYLRTLGSFEVRVSTTRDELDANGQKLQFVGNLDYKVRRPNGFVITSDESGRTRQLLYDGKTLTLFTPSTGFYARVSAPPTIRQTLTLAADRYDIRPPLVDLFKWGEGDDGVRRLTSGYRVGEATVEGQLADQYAFRQSGVDWQIWIARGARPLPLRVAVTSTAEPERPTFNADLSWKTREQFADNTFAFHPPASAVQIGIASIP